MRLGQEPHDGRDSDHERAERDHDRAACAPAASAPSSVHSLACKDAFSSTPEPARATASTPPVSELRRKRMLLRPARSRALTTVGSPGVSPPKSTETLVPAVTYRPASTTQSSPSG